MSLETLQPPADREATQAVDPADLCERFLRDRLAGQYRAAWVVPPECIPAGCVLVRIKPESKGLLGPDQVPAAPDFPLEPQSAT
jgi:hypothetical protein